MDHIRSFRTENVLTSSSGLAQSNSRAEEVAAAPDIEDEEENNREENNPQPEPKVDSVITVRTHLCAAELTGAGGDVITSEV